MRIFISSPQLLAEKSAIDLLWINLNTAN